MVGFRVETDSLGPINVPADKYWGSQTQKCFENFEVGDHGLERMPVEVVESLGYLKAACAKANLEAGRLTPDIGAAIIQAAGEVSSGKLHEHFPLRVWQTGSGTQSNMNSNEVIAKRATQILSNDQNVIPEKNVVHPNDMVNLGQSSNDVFPSVMHITLARVLHNTLIPELKATVASFKKKESEWSDLVKIGRTHLMDAVPLTLGQEMSAYVNALESSLEILEGQVKTNIQQLAQGGTAVGTGLNTFEGFDNKVASNLAQSLNIPFTAHPNKFAALSMKNAAVDLSGAVTTLATTLFKIASDIRLLASGPRCGLAELSLPANEPGSSIMPGKVNPTQCEALTMICAQVFGNNQTVIFSNTQGHLQLNVFKPVITANVTRSMNILAGGMKCFRLNCIEGMTANKTRINALMGESLMLVTCLTPIIGYDVASKAALEAHNTGKTLKDVVVNVKKCMSSEEFDLHVDAKKMLAPKKL